MTFAEAMEKAQAVAVTHACGHWVKWLLLLETVTKEEAWKSMEQQECPSCRRAKERGAEWSEE